MTHSNLSLFQFKWSRKGFMRTRWIIHNQYVVTFTRTTHFHVLTFDFDFSGVQFLEGKKTCPLICDSDIPSYHMVLRWETMCLIIVVNPDNHYPSLFNSTALCGILASLSTLFWFLANLMISQYQHKSTFTLPGWKGNKHWTWAY